MRWPWQHRRESERSRRQREIESDDARVNMRALAEELKRSIDRLEQVVTRMEGETP